MNILSAVAWEKVCVCENKRGGQNCGGGAYRGIGNKKQLGFDTAPHANSLNKAFKM